MCLKAADRMTNSVEPDTTAPPQEEQSDLGLHCLPRPVCVNINRIIIHFTAIVIIMFYSHSSFYAPNFEDSVGMSMCDFRP